MARDMRMLCWEHRRGWVCERRIKWQEESEAGGSCVWLLQCKVITLEPPPQTSPHTHTRTRNLNKGGRDDVCVAPSTSWFQSKCSRMEKDEGRQRCHWFNGFQRGQVRTGGHSRSRKYPWGSDGQRSYIQTISVSLTLSLTGEQGHLYFCWSWELERGEWMLMVFSDRTHPIWYVPNLHKTDMIVTLTSRQPWLW